MKNRKRNIPIQFYVNKVENELINKKIEDSNLNKSEYLRQVALGNKIVNIDMSYLNKVIFEINKIGININQITKVVNDSKSIYKDEVENLNKKIDDIWEIIYKSF